MRPRPNLWHHKVHQEWECLGPEQQHEVEDAKVGWENLQHDLTKVSSSTLTNLSIFFLMTLPLSQKFVSDHTLPQPDPAT